MAEQVYKVQDPQGNIRQIVGPAGASDEEVILRAQELFASTEGGAATGRQVTPRQVEDKGIQAVTDILGSGVIGAVGGVIAPRLLQGAGQALAFTPFPATQVIGRGLSYAGMASEAAGPAVRGVEGAVSGLASEAVGKAVEGVTENKWATEGSRIIAGGLTPTALKSIGSALGAGLRLFVTSRGATITGRPDLAFAELANQVKDNYAKRKGGQLTIEEVQYIDQQIAELAGNQKPGDALSVIAKPLQEGAKQIKSAADVESERLFNQSNALLNSANNAANQEVQMALDVARKGASSNADKIDYLKSLKQHVLEKSQDLLRTVGTPRAKSEIGSDIQSIVFFNNQSLRNNAAKTYQKTNEDVLKIVKEKESGNVFPSSLKEYSDFVSDLTRNTVPGVRSADVAKSFQKILDNVTTKDGKVSYQALDDARRLLGEVYSGRPPEGYSSIDADTARKYYKVISEIQKKYVGPKQAELLDAYAGSKEGLEIFSSQYGKKLIGLDPNALRQLKTDPANVPSYFFKSPKSYNALISLIGNKEIADVSAKEFVAGEISNLTTARQVRQWLGKNHDFLKAVPDIRDSVIKYGNQLEKTEKIVYNIDKASASLAKQESQLPLQAQREAEQRAKSIRAGGLLQSDALRDQATTVTRDASKAADMIFNSSVGPLKNVRNLIENGNINAWNVAAPIIKRSGVAKDAVANAVREVAATSKVSQRHFDEVIAPPLLTFDMISKEMADSISAKLSQIESGRLPDNLKRKIRDQLLTDALIGYSGSLSARNIGLGQDGLGQSGLSMYNLIVPQ